MGKIKKGIQCSILNCNKPAVKYVSKEKLSEVKFSLNSESGKAYLCEEHYKMFKKKIRSIKKLEKWRFMT
ncbi:MAG: hypothetical protein QXL69_06560 [Candidatus Bathyarchaeia archaeon]|nr:hypothetical protein [Candidatus Bathyarchaeota archaeon]